MISTLALESLTVAFTVASATPCPTDPVDAIAPDAKPGISVNPLSESVLSVASVDPARVTTVRGNLNNFLRYSWAVAL